MKIFGTTIHGSPFVHQRARVTHPWNLTLHDKSCLGDGAHAYALGRIEIGQSATVAQETYLCTGSHRFASERMELITEPITIGDYVFIGARSFILPGVSIGDHSVIGACSLVTKDMPPWMVCAGHPCKPIKERIMKSELK